jgi:hypothetical protein
MLELLPLITTWLKGYFKNESSCINKNTLHLRLAHNRSKELKLVNNASHLPPQFIANIIKYSCLPGNQSVFIVSDLPHGHPELDQYIAQLGSCLPDLSFVSIPRPALPLYDLFVMSQTTDLLFLSNSTFSVWGSLLNKHALVYAPYLGNLEKWATSAPHAQQLYFDVRKYGFINHLGVDLEHMTSPSRFPIKLVFKIFDFLALFVPFISMIKHRAERYYAKRYL